MVDDIINGLSRMQQIGSYGGTPVIVLA